MSIVDQDGSNNMNVRFSNRKYVDLLLSSCIQTYSNDSILRVLFIVTSIIISTAAAGYFSSLVFAFASLQNSSTNNATMTNTNSGPIASNQHNSHGNDQIILKPVGIGKNNATNQPQIIDNISSKGIYKVQIEWRRPLTSQSPEVSKNGFGLEVRFLNGTAQSATSKNIPNKRAESGVTTMGVGTQYRVPGAIERLMPVNSYDLTVYDNHGNILWNKMNQYVSAGIGLEQVVLPNGYSGEIHILIHNIKSNNLMTGSNITPLSTPLSKGTTDSTDSTDFIVKVS